MRLMSSVRCQAARLMLSAGARSTMPAQLTRMSMPPISASTAATTASTLSASATLQAHAVAAGRAAARALTASALRSRSASRAPFAANTSAIAAPMPEAAPVTTATLPAREKSRSTGLGVAGIDLSPSARGQQAGTHSPIRHPGESRVPADLYVCTREGVPEGSGFRPWERVKKSPTRFWLSYGDAVAANRKRAILRAAHSRARWNPAFAF